jgi:hypothetical protein
VARTATASAVVISPRSPPDLAQGDGPVLEPAVGPAQPFVVGQSNASSSASPLPGVDEGKGDVPSLVGVKRKLPVMSGRSGAVSTLGLVHHAVGPRKATAASSMLICRA